MWKFLKAMFGTTSHARSPDIASVKSEAWVSREGRSARADEVFAAWTSRDIPRMLSALKLKTNAVDRHFLLMTIVAETYRRRDNADMAQMCARVAEMHIAEFARLAAPLRRDMEGVLPRVTTFQHYATLLTEQAEFDRAIEVCETAISFGLHDRTQSGFEGRIERIKKKRLKHLKEE